MGLLTPFTEVFLAIVVGARPYQIAYWISVSLGLIVFFNGFVAAMITVNAPMALTEILPMPTEMQYPVVFGCISDDIFVLGGSGVEFTDGCNSTSAKAPCTAEINGETSSSGVKVNFFDYLDRAEATPSEKNAAAMLKKVAASLGSDYSADAPKCWAANYEQEFKPQHGTKTSLQFGFIMPKAMTGKESYGIIGFYQAGTTDAADASYAYGGFQNVLHTMGVSVDEEVDAQGSSWYPKTEGKTVERYRINTAITPAVWSGTSAEASLTATTTGESSGSTRNTFFVFYLDTFIRRRTTIRNKSATETLNELGAAFGAAMLFMTWLFTDVEYVADDGGNVQTAKKFRFMSFKTAQARLKPGATTVVSPSKAALAV